VLITRSRLRCEVFTNLTADDIDLNRSQARGVVAFKRFLKYAQTGIMDVPEETGRESGSPFEDAVAQALREAGYTVEGQVGSAGFFIDLAVIDPKKPGRYLLGIECDGASYHSARSARDRDRLRQQVLEGLGWRIHRIWSTDWFRNPDRELKRVVSAIEDAAARGDSTEIPVPIRPETTIERVDADGGEDAQPATGVPAYVPAALSIRTGGLELHAVPVERLAGWVVQVVEVESPVHIDDAMRRITDAADVSRLGGRIRAALEAAIVRASLDGRIEQRGPFLWLSGMIEPPLRDRIAVEDRALSNVAPEEIAVAIRTAIANAYGIEQADIAAATCRLLGFPRMTEDMRAIVDPLIEAMLASGHLQRQGHHLTVA
jgi:very-short-patch-repair endonuclease